MILPKAPRDRMLLSLVVLAAVLLRCRDITQPLVDAFSWREASTAMMADNFQNSSWNIFYPEVNWVGPGPGYQGRELPILPYAAALLFSIFGWHDWIGRAVAVAFSVLTVLSLHRLTARLWGETAAHYAAFAYALLPGAILIDRAFLPDPAMLALVTSGAWAFVIYVDDRRPGSLVLATTLFTLGALTKLPGMAVAPVILYLALSVPQRGALTPRFVLAVTLAGLCSLAAIAAYYAWAIHLGRTYPPYHVAGSGYLWTDGLAAFLQAAFHVDSASRTIGTWFATGPVLALAGVGLLAGTGSAQRGHLVFHVWLLGAAMIYLLAAREIAANVWNFHILSIPLAAFAGRGMMALVTLGPPTNVRIRLALRFAAITAVVVTFGVLPAWQLMARPYAGTSKLLGDALEQASAPGDLVVTVASKVGDPTAIFYSRRKGWVFPPGGGQRDWSTFVDDDTAIAQLADMKQKGAKWFGIARDARDSENRLFFQHHERLVHQLDQTAHQIVVTPAFVIYRL